MQCNEWAKDWISRKKIKFLGHCWDGLLKKPKIIVCFLYVCPTDKECKQDHTGFFLQDCGENKS